MNTDKYNKWGIFTGECLESRKAFVSSIYDSSTKKYYVTLSTTLHEYQLKYSVATYEKAEKVVSRIRKAIKDFGSHGLQPKHWRLTYER
jgi:hypothetical protein